jgi:hypothetical protein
LRSPVHQAEPPRPTPRLQNPTPITYLGHSTFVVKGAATGLTYLFTRHEALSVDERDVSAFVATGIFAASELK